MNTGFVRPAVATVLTVYGIETFKEQTFFSAHFALQQYLPFTVLKPIKNGVADKVVCYQVATVLTVYGIETYKFA